MKKKLCTVKVHSIVDLITNSSTELFCVVKANTEDDVRKIIQDVLDECGCKVLDSDWNGEGLYVEPHISWDEESPDYDKEVEGQYDIMYEQHAPPCTLILNKIKETFEVIHEGY